MLNIQWNGVTATTPSGKAAALSNRFYPIVEADLIDLTDYEFIGRTLIELHIACTVTEWEVFTALRRAKPDKCLGIDEIPNWFLHAMGELLIQALTTLINQCWAAEYYLKQFQAACTIVLQKPDKPDYTDLGAWRPIALLSTLGKTIESIMA
jgi:hypothetical protein